MAKLVRWLGYASAGLLALFLILGAWAISRWLARFNDSVTLPNGMVAQRSFDFTRIGRNDLFGKDGVTLLAGNIEFICFNDRYVDVYSIDGYSGLYDGNTDGKVPNRLYDEVLSVSGLQRNGGPCNGYFTGLIGPSLFYDGNKWPFLPPCEWRNMGNPDLLHREWFERPCDNRTGANFGTDRAKDREASGKKPPSR